MPARNENTSLLSNTNSRRLAHRAATQNNRTCRPQALVHRLQPAHRSGWLPELAKGRGEAWTLERRPAACRGGKAALAYGRPTLSRVAKKRPAQVPRPPFKKTGMELSGVAISTPFFGLLAGLVLLVSTLAAIAGTGGGSLLIPVFSLALPDDVHRAVPLSKTAVFGVALGACILNFTSSSGPNT